MQKKRTTAAIITSRRNDTNAHRQQVDARLDIRAQGLWGWQQDAFSNIRVFHPNTSSYRSTNILELFRQHEMAKRREYGDRIREVEYAVLTPLVFSTTAGMGNIPTVSYKALLSLLHRSENQNKVQL